MRNGISACEQGGAMQKETALLIAVMHGRICGCVIVPPVHEEHAVHIEWM